MIPDHSDRTLAQLLDLSGRRAVVTGREQGQPGGVAGGEEEGVGGITSR